MLVTGFTVFAGLQFNPAEEIARRLDGQVIGGHRVHGLVLPVPLKHALLLLKGAAGGAETQDSAGPRPRAPGPGEPHSS